MRSEMYKDLISVIIPVYNVSGYLDRCISSVINQTYRNLQIILVDDGSTDGSGELCDYYAARDVRIEVIHKKNGGAADARNRGLEAADGKYIGFVDGDDYIAEDMYECLYVKMMAGTYDIACCGRTDLYEESFHVKAHKSFVKKSVVYMNREQAIKSLCLYDGMDFSPCDKLYVKDLFDGVRFPPGRSSEDIPVVYEVYKKAAGVVHIGSAKYFYCHRKGSSTGSGFYFRRMDYFFFIRDIYSDIMRYNPAAAREAEAMLYRAVLTMWKSVRMENKKKAHYICLEKKLQRLIIRSFVRYMLNSYITLVEKIDLCKVMIKNRKKQI